MYKASRKAKKIFKKAKASVFELRQMLSYLGWIKATDTYEAYTKEMKPFVSVRNCKRRISNYDRRMNYEMAA